MPREDPTRLPAVPLSHLHGDGPPFLLGSSTSCHSFRLAICGMQNIRDGARDVYTKFLNDAGINRTNRRSSGKKCNKPRMPKKNAELATPSVFFLLQSTVPSEVRKGNARRAQATTHNQHLGMTPLYFCNSSSRNADCDDRPIYRDADAEGRPHQHPSMELRWARDQGE